jgi:hypothetical protein
VVFYNVDREKAFVAAGEVASKPKSNGSNTHYHYRASLRRIRVLDLPLALVDARRMFPLWRWLRYTRNMTTTSSDLSRALWAELGGERERSTPDTGSRADTLFGDKLYQLRAKSALPVLVNLAQQGAKIYYDDLAQELGISNPRVLNFVLGSVGKTLLALARRWREKIPPLQMLVVNKQHELPGDGVGYFIAEANYRKMPATEKRRVVDKLHRLIWAFGKWDAVLAACMINEVSPAKASAARKKARFQGGGFGDSRTNRLVEKAAIKCVKRHLRKNDYRVRSRERERIGYDLDAIRADETLHIEVKGISGHIVEFLITSGEVAKARNDPSFRLFAVTHALSKNPVLHHYPGQQLLAAFDLEPTAFRAILK